MCPKENYPTQQLHRQKVASACIIAVIHVLSITGTYLFRLFIFVQLCCTCVLYYLTGIVVDVTLTPSI